MYEGAWAGRIRLARKKAPERRRLTMRQARNVMLSSESSTVLAAKYGMTRQSIDLVRTGKTYSDVYRKLQQKGERLWPLERLLCEQCVHWRSDRGCDFDFPDAGGDFATDCSLFRQL